MMQTEYYVKNSNNEYEPVHFLTDATIVNLSDTGNYYNSSNVEGALQEVGSSLEESTNEILNVQRSYKEIKPSFCTIDDDCKSDVYTILKPILEARGIKGTFALITGSIGETQRLTQAQLLDMLIEGHEFVSHTHTHQNLTTLTETQIIAECVNSQAILNNLGMTADVLVYPNGGYSKSVIEVIRKYFKCAVATNGINKGPISTYVIYRIGIGAWGYDDLDTIKARINDVIAKNSLCVLETHVGDNTEAQNTLMENVFDYILSLGYTFETFSDAYEKHKNILEYGEYDEYTQQMEFAIGYDGVVGGLGADTKVTNIIPDSVTSSTEPSEFPNGKISYCSISNQNAAGFPQNGGGVLCTNKISMSDYQYYQEYILQMSNSKYRRYWNRYTPVWSKWVSESYENAITASITFDTPINSFDSSIIVKCFSDTDAENAPLPNVGGTLITYNTSGSYSYGIQLYYVRNNQQIYKRYSTSNTAWSAWALITQTGGSTRPVNITVGATFFDTTLNKPIWCKTAGIRRADTLTVTTGATVSGNITLTLAGVAFAIAVLAGETASMIGDKILAKKFSGWLLSGTAGTGIVKFTKRLPGVYSQLVFSDTDLTGVTVTVAANVIGTESVWVDATGATV